MRTVLSVPERHRDAIREVGSLSPNEVQLLVEHIAKASPTEEALRGVFEKHLSTPAAYDALMSAAVFRSAHNLKAGIAALEMTRALGEEVSADAIATLLEAPNLVLAAKAIDLQSTGERVLHTSRIVTDVRPLFDEEDDPNPLGALVVHNLALTTFSASGTTDTFVVLDDEDLLTLRDHIDRALAKGQRARAVLGGGALKILEDV